MTRCPAGCQPSSLSPWWLLLAAVPVLVAVGHHRRGRGGMLGGCARPHQAVMALALDIIEDMVVECWLLFSSSSSRRGSASGCRLIIEDMVGCWAAVLALVESPWLCLWLSVDHQAGGMLGCPPRPRRAVVALALAVSCHRRDLVGHWLPSSWSSSSSWLWLWPLAVGRCG